MYYIADASYIFYDNGNGMTYDKSLLVSETEEDTEEIPELEYSESETENEESNKGEESNEDEGYECKKRKR